MKKLKWLLFAPLFIGGILALGWLVMWLWNYLFPAIAPLSAITFPQALALLVLCKILFGGFKGGKGFGPGHRFKERANMTEEERAQMKEEWRRRCGGASNEADE